MYILEESKLIEPSLSKLGSKNQQFKQFVPFYLIQVKNIDKQLVMDLFNNL